MNLLYTCTVKGTKSCGDRPGDLPKSHALIASEHGRALGFGQGRGANPDSVGHAELAARLADIRTQALAHAGLEKSDIAGAGFGISGFDWPSQRPLMLDTIARLGLACPVVAVNDALVGLLAGSQKGWGVALVAGTGCNCWGWDHQRRAEQVTGLGDGMAEGAGAGEMVTRAVGEVARCWTRRGPETALTEAFCLLVGARDALDLLEGLGMGRYHLHAAAAPVIFRVAAEGAGWRRRLWIGPGTSWATWRAV